jgi:hypothetical protein
MSDPLVVAAAKFVLGLVARNIPAIPTARKLRSLFNASARQ